MTRRWKKLNRAPRRRHQERRRTLRPSERDDRIRVTIVLSPRTSTRARDNAVHALARQWPQARKYLTFDELCYLHGATKDAAERVADHFAAHRMTVHDVSPARRTVLLSGKFADVARVFGVRPVVRDHPEHHYRSFEGRITIPGTLTRDITAVLGLDQGPLLRRHAGTPVRLSARGVDPATVARIYDFPHFVRGLNQTIGIISLGGGFHLGNVRRGDKGTGRGSVEVIEVAGATNAPAPRPFVSAYLREIGLRSADTGSLKVQVKPATPRFNNVVWTLETSMDVQVAAALAPDARILVYMAPNTEAGKFDALMRAIMTRNSPSVISCSWGNVERQFTSGWVQLLEEIFQTAALAGITMCYSSGDSSASPHYPASSPHVLACGGTTLDVTRPRVPERCWSENVDGQQLMSGGGVSQRFRKDPAWQTPARVRGVTGRHGRGLPDVAARANLSPGYTVRIGRIEAGLGGGTSASAPLWAALVARINQALRARCGYITPLLYNKRCRKAFRDITEGSNGAYHARPGWDACTGWGTPRGTKLLNALRPRRR